MRITWALFLTAAITVAGDIDSEDYRRRASVLAPNDAGGHFRLALWCEKQGLKAPARRHYRAVLAVRPEHRAARRALGSGCPDTRAQAREALKLVQSRDAAQRERGMAAIQLLDRSERERALRIATRSRQAAVRLAAVRALGRAARPVSVKALVSRALLDPVKEIRAAAVASLAATRQSASIFVPALRSPRTRLRAIEALGALGDSGAARLLIRGYLSAGGNPQRAYIATTTQVSYVQDFDVEVA
jgi:HEAT repeat protein